MPQELTFTSKSKAEAYVNKKEKTHHVAGPTKVYIVTVGGKKPK